MRVPRQWSGADLKKALAALGYEETRQTGSHVRLTTQMRGVHHVTVPDHKVLPLFLSGPSSRSSETLRATLNARPTRSWRVCWARSDAIIVFSPMRAGGFAILRKRDFYGRGVTGKRPRIFEHQLPPGLRLRRRGGPGAELG